MKKTYLVGYSYGMGGVCALISAESEGDIKKRYPFLIIIKDKPPFPAEYFRTLYEKGPFDIDAEPPEWIKLADQEYRSEQE